MTLITDLDEIKTLVAQRQDEFEVMRYMLQLDDDLNDTQLDKLIDTIATPIIEAIDCTQCANCCRSLDVYLTQSDASNLAAHLDIPLRDITLQYIDTDTAPAVEEWGKFRHQPCALLDGKRCAVYTHRPDTCRRYPQFTPDFRWVLDDLIEGAAVCPIIYNVLSEVAQQADDIIKNA